MPAVDLNGNVFRPAEDGYVYSIPQGSGMFTTPNAKLFTIEAIGAAYTPLSFDSGRRIYTQNNGHLFAVCN